MTKILNIILVTLFLIPTLGYSMTYQCDFENEDGVRGDVKLVLKRRSADVSLDNGSSLKRYNNCDISNDDFGILIDCNAGNLDFMILLNNKVKPAKGGIMSSTHNLFVDIEC